MLQCLKIGVFCLVSDVNKPSTYSIVCDEKEVGVIELRITPTFVFILNIRIFEIINKKKDYLNNFMIPIDYSTIIASISKFMPNFIEYYNNTNLD